MSNLSLPSPSEWRLEPIDPSDHELAKLATEIAACPPEEELIMLLAGALKKAILGSTVRICQEDAIDARGGLRAVIRFHAPRPIFNQFFNGHAGYRAHYYASPDLGLAFNNQAVLALTAEIANGVPDRVNGLHIGTDGLEDPTPVGKEFVLQSLVAGLSKLWVGNSVSFTGPRILLPDGRSWRSILCDSDAGWIEMKGAFVTFDGQLYQPKDPQVRARDLQRDGKQ